MREETVEPSRSFPPPRCREVPIYSGLINRCYVPLKILIVAQKAVTLDFGFRETIEYSQRRKTAQRRRRKTSTG